MKTASLPLYEVEFLPVERRLRERRQASPATAWNGVERRRGERRQAEHRLQQPGA